MEDLKRRAFIRNSFLAGTGISLTIPEIFNKSVSNLSDKSVIQNKISTKKIVVAGAGISGLCSAYELMKAGHEVMFSKPVAVMVDMFSPGGMDFPMDLCRLWSGPYH